MTEQTTRQHGMGGGQVAADELRLLIERAERLEEEKKGISDDIKDVMAEAKGRGFDKKALGEVLRMRAMSDEQRQLVEFYLDVTGVFS